MTTLEIPSTVAIIVGRIQVDGDAALPAVHQLQDQFTVTPLVASSGRPAGVPVPDPELAPRPPAGLFRPILRAYEPGNEILAGTYELPKMRRVG